MTTRPNDDQVDAVLRESLDGTTTVDEFETKCLVITALDWSHLSREERVELVNNRILAIVREWFNDRK